MNLLIAIDDTDNKESVGTGRLARMLAQDLTDSGLIKQKGITRHQFLVHPDIPYTSHNSCACIEADAEVADTDKIFDFSKNFILTHFNEGANPGLCVLDSERVPEELVRLGRRAQTEVIAVEDARKLADQLGIPVWWHGDTGQGVIGAMGGIGLRSTGNDGKFIGMKGIREMEGTVTVGEICKKTSILRVITSTGEILGENETVNTMNWIRPLLKEGDIVLPVLKEEDEWRTIEKAKRKKGKGKI
jgi:tRNA(Ile2) C34 agmatinyltransferase TiaS